ncbi:hypothetical protein FDB41_11965 [Clostridium botulinum]|nr:hypothetical protein [Clostridium botulinum]NFO54245.1 hypothetical protein [Clostridium botulinum]
MSKLLSEVKYDEELEKWVVEVEKDGKKLLLGHSISDIFMEYEKYSERQDAVNYIRKSDKLELRKLNKDKCKAYIMNDTDTVIAENERQALDWYMDYVGCNFNETVIKECNLNESYIVIDGDGANIIEGKDTYETIGDGLEKYFKYENYSVTEPFVICSTEW